MFFKTLCPPYTPLYALVNSLMRFSIVTRRLRGAAQSQNLEGFGGGGAPRARAYLWEVSPMN